MIKKLKALLKARALMEVISEEKDEAVVLMNLMRLKGQYDILSLFLKGNELRDILHFIETDVSRETFGMKEEQKWDL